MNRSNIYLLLPATIAFSLCTYASEHIQIPGGEHPKTPWRIEQAKISPHTILERITDLKANLQENDVLFLDIDDTVLTTGRNKYKSPVTPNEKDIEKTLFSLKAKGVIVLYLTARDGRFADRTENHLRSIGIDPSGSIHWQSISSDYFQSSTGVKKLGGAISFRNGIIYAKPRKGVKGRIKGEALVAFLDFFKLNQDVQKKYGEESQRKRVRILDPSKIERLIFVDDLPENNESFVRALSNSSYQHIPRLSYVFKKQPSENRTGHTKPTGRQALNTPKKLYEYAVNPSTVFPDSILHLEYQETLAGGSSGVHIMKDRSGRIFTLKCSPRAGDIDHFKEELVSDLLVLLLSAPAPSFAIYDHRPVDKRLGDEQCPDYKPFYRLAEFIESSTATSVEKISEGLKKRFVIDAYLANWDVVAGRGKNVILGKKDGRLYSVDHGGALRYRARGQLKEESTSWKPDQVSEILSFRDPTKSKEGAQIYEGIKRDALIHQVRELLNNYQTGMVAKELRRLHAVLSIKDFTGLQRMLADRIVSLHQEFSAKDASKPIGIIAETHKQAIKGQSSAGVFLYTDIDGEPYTLLGQRRRHRWWGNFGGKSDIKDRFLSETAARETREESNQLISLLPMELDDHPSHDLYTLDGVYRMYFSPSHYVAAQKFIDALAKPKPHGDEYTDFLWVRVSDLLMAAISIDEAVMEEAQPTVKLKVAVQSLLNKEGNETKRDIILHPPLLKMLRQKPVLQALNNLVHKKPLGAQHTKGFAEEDAYLHQPIALDKSITKMSIKTKWPKVIPGQPICEPTSVNHKIMPLGQTANGDPIQMRTTIIGLQDNSIDKNAKRMIVEEQIVHSPLEDRERLNRAILAHGAVMAEMKSRTARNTYDNRENNSMKNRLLKRPMTQSEVHMKYMLKDRYVHVTDHNEENDIRANLFIFLTEVSKLKDRFAEIVVDEPLTDISHPLIDSLTQAWIQERKAENRGKVIAYHGVDPLIGSLYDIFTELRRQLMIIGFDETVVTRSLDLAFDGLFTMAEFQREQLLEQNASDVKIIDNYGDSYRNKGLSANPFLLGSDGHEGSSSVMYALKSGCKLLNNRHGFLEYIKRYLEVDFNTTDFFKILQNAGELNKRGRLFQFIYEPKIAEDLAYSSRAGGFIVALDKDLNDYKRGYSGVVGLIDNIRHNIDDTLSALGGKPDINDLQLRLFVEPNRTLNPSMVKVKKYWLKRPTEQDILDYEAKLKVFVKQITLQLLNKKTQLLRGTLRSVDATMDGLTPIQRLEKYVGEYSAGEKNHATVPAIGVTNALFHGDAAYFRSNSRALEQMSSLVEARPYINAAGKRLTFSPLEHALKRKHSGLLAVIKDYYNQEAHQQIAAHDLNLVLNAHRTTDTKLAMADFLLRQGAKLDQQRGRLLLDKSLKDREFQLSQILVEGGADDTIIDDKYIDDHDLLNTAVKHRNLWLIKYLRDRFPDLKIDDASIEYAVNGALRPSHFDTIRYLLEEKIIVPSTKLYARFSARYAKNRSDVNIEALGAFFAKIDTVKLADIDQHRGAVNGTVLYVTTDELWRHHKTLKKFIVSKMSKETTKELLSRLNNKK